jgi:hypothetical protein
MRSRLVLLVLVALVAIPLSGNGQTPSAAPPNRSAATSREIPAAEKPSREQLLKLFQVMRIRSQMEEMLRMLPAALQQQLQSEQTEVELSLMQLGGELTAAQKSARDRVTQKYFALAEKQYPVDEMLSDMVEVYQRNLSREDVDGIIAFYRSTPGQHLLDAQPLMAKEVMPAVTKKFEDRDKDLVERYKKELNDVMGPPRVPPPSTPKS